MVQSYQAPIRVYKYPFDIVMKAYEKRFPSCDLIPVFVDSEIIEDNYDANTKVHVIKRRCKLKVDAPYLLKKIIGMDFVYFVQINTLDYTLKCLKIEAYNENFSTRVKMLETCYYKVHPQNPYWTCFEQEASLNIISFFNFENILEKVIIKQYIKSIGEGKEILLHFLKQMGHVEEYPDIGDNLYKDLQLGSADPKVFKNRLKMSFRGKPVADTPDYIILTTFQSQKLSEFKEILTGKFSGKMPNDTHLMRFLAARDMDVLKACEMLLASLMWRKHHRIDQILQNYKVPEVLEKYYPGGWLKNDTNKVLPLYYLRLGQMDIKGLYNSIGLDGIIKHTLYVCEQGLDLCRSSFPCSSALDNRVTEQNTPNNKSSIPLFPSTLSSPPLCLKQNHSNLTTINPLKSVHQDSLIQSKAFKNKAKSYCNLTKKDTVVDIQQNYLNDDILNLKNTANSVNNEGDTIHFPRKTGNLAENSQSLQSSFLFSTTTLSDEAGDDMTSGIVTQESDEFTSQRSTSMSTDVAYQSRTEIHANHPNTNNFAQKDLRKKLFNPSLSMAPNRNSSPCFSSGISSNDGSQHFVMNSEIGQLPINQPTEINVKSNNHIQNSQSKKRNSDCVSAYVSPYAWNLMLDLRGLSVKHLWTPGLKAMSRLIEIVEANYPETLDALYIIGAPRIFSVIWSLASSMLDDKTREKIHFIALDSKEGICCTDNGAINNLNETNENIAEYSSLLNNITGDPKFLNDEKIDHINGKIEFQALSDNKANIVSRKSSANNNNVIVKTESTNDIFNCFGFLSPNSSLSDDGGQGSPHDRNMKYLMCETHKPCAKFGTLVGSWRDNENINAYLYDKDVYEMTVPKSYYLSELVLNAHKQAFDRDVYETFQLLKDNYYEVVIDINKPNTIITWDFDVLKFESTFSLLYAGRCHTFPNNSEKNIGFLSTETESPDKSFINQGSTSILEKGNREHPIKVEFNRICHEGDSIQGSHFTKESLGTYILQWKNFSNTTMNNTTHTNNNSNCNPLIASMVKSSTVPISTTRFDSICQSTLQPISKPQNIHVPSTENVSVSSSIFDFSPFFSSITSTFGPKNLDASKDINSSWVQNSSQINPNNVVQSPVTSPGPHQLHSSTMAMTNKCKIAYYYQVIYPQASAIQIRSSENANQNTIESSTKQLKQPNNNLQNLNEIPLNKRSSSMESVQSSLSYLSLDNGQNG